MIHFIFPDVFKGVNRNPDRSRATKGGLNREVLFASHDLKSDVAPSECSLCSTRQFKCYHLTILSSQSLDKHNT